MKTFKFDCYRHQDAKRLTCRLGDYLRSQDLLVAGADSKMIPSGHSRHHGFVKTYDFEGQTSVDFDTLITAARHVVQIDTHVWRRIQRGDSMLGKCVLTYGDMTYDIFAAENPSKPDL